MEGKRAHPWVHHWIADLANRQHGVVAWFQLRAAGVTRGEVDSRLARGLLHHVHRGVYAVGHRVLTIEGHRMAAVLALGPTAVLSHRSAAEHWGLLPASAAALIHVTVPGRSRRRQRRGIAVHLAPSAQVTVERGVPITTVPWTLLDVAATTNQRVVDRAVERAEMLRILDLRQVAPLLDQVRPGVAPLRAALAGYAYAPTASELETRFLELCDEFAIPRPQVNAMVEGYQVDFVWREHRLVVETDGLQWHGARGARMRDHQREAKLALAGYWTQRFDWEQVTSGARGVADVVLHLLDERQP